MLAILLSKRNEINRNLSAAECAGEGHLAGRLRCAVGAMMCLIHYFGIVAVGLIAVSQFFCNFRDIRQRWLIAAALTVFSYIMKPARIIRYALPAILAFALSWESRAYSPGSRISRSICAARPLGSAALNRNESISGWSRRANAG